MNHSRELEPDRAALATFVNAIFKHAGTEGFVSLRSFVENPNKTFRIQGVALSGGLDFLIDAAADDAYRAANAPHSVVFCPPLAVFTNKDRATERDLLKGLALSVECDKHPREALAKLETVLGKPTVIVRSGGAWTDPKTEQVHDKLHLHWRLAKPATGGGLLKLKQARDLAARIAGGDTSNTPVVHPIRWPGSWHRKGEAKLCKIEAASKGGA